MLYIHPEECIDCGACEPECPNNAIYEGGVEWAITDGTSVKGSFTLRGARLHRGRHSGKHYAELKGPRARGGKGLFQQVQGGLQLPRRLRA